MLNFEWNNLNDLILYANCKRTSFFETSNLSIANLLDQDNILDDIRLHFNTASNWYEFLIII